MNSEKLYNITNVRSVLFAGLTIKDLGIVVLLLIIGGILGSFTPFYILGYPFFIIAGMFWRIISDDKRFYGFLEMTYSSLGLKSNLYGYAIQYFYNFKSIEDSYIMKNDTEGVGFFKLYSGDYNTLTEEEKYQLQLQYINFLNNENNFQIITNKEKSDLMGYLDHYRKSNTIEDDDEIWKSKYLDNFMEDIKRDFVNEQFELVHYYKFYFTLPKKALDDEILKEDTLNKVFQRHYGFLQSMGIEAEKISKSDIIRLQTGGSFKVNSNYNSMTLS